MSRAGLARDGRVSAKPAAQTADGFVTREEAKAALTKVRQIIYRVVLKKNAPNNALNVMSPICSRKELVEVLFSWFKATENEFKVTPVSVQYEPAQMSIPLGDATRPKLEKLVAWGFIGRVDPLATSAKQGLTAAEFGDAVGYFLCRLSDLTHTPSNKFSPALMGPGD